MLEKPDLQEEKIAACLQDEYRLPEAQVAFLPLGADQNTAVYRVVAQDNAPYFLKLRSGAFDQTSVDLPKYLNDQGIHAIIAPLATAAGRLWACLGDFKTILYPFVQGQDGYGVALSERQWRKFGAALKSIHTTALPMELAERIPRETYSPQWRQAVKRFLALVETETFVDPVAVKLAAFLRAKRAETLDLVERAGQRLRELQTRPQELVLCHSDLHAGNILIDGRGALYIVDWDNSILAPKERDLMYPGGGQGFSGHTPQEEEALFYRGYGPVQFDPAALAYYRYERIVQDIAVFCEQLLLTDEGGADREQSFHYLVSNFLPGGTVEITYQADKTEN
ncbi:MAG: aminoglycoside phosphotransferase family protein [Chloroflexota bacterium]